MGLAILGPERGKLPRTQESAGLLDAGGRVG